ncbi:MAG: proliferating cell nuclear antigen (pcna) [Promethearchaeota archaeon]
MAGDFKATLTNSKILRGIIEAVHYLIEETYIYASPDGIRMTAIDETRVAMLHAELLKDLFTSYSCSEKFKIGVNINDMIKILRRAKPSDEIELNHSPTNPNDLSILMKSERSKRTFRIKSRMIEEMDDGDEKKKENIMEQLNETFKDKFTAVVKMDGLMLDEITKDALIISDTIKIQVLQAENVINFLAFDETGEVDIEIDLESGVLDKKVTGDSEGTYALNFLDNIIKIQSVVDSLELSLGSNIPMKLEGNLQDESGNNTGGKIVYLLAPRVDDDEEEFDDENFEMDDFE